MDRRDGVRAIAEGVLLELQPPEVPNLLVAQTGDDLPAVALVAQEPQDVRQRRRLLLQESIDRVAQDVLHADAPRILPVLLERLHDAGGSEGDGRRAHLVQRIVAERLTGIRHVEVVEVGRSIRWDRCDKAFHQVAVGVDKAEAMTGVDILPDQGLQQCGLARAGLTNGIGVEKAIDEAKAKHGSIGPVVRNADIRNGVGDRLHCLSMNAEFDRGRR